MSDTQKVYVAVYAYDQLPPVVCYSLKDLINALLKECPVKDYRGGQKAIVSLDSKGNVAVKCKLSKGKADIYVTIHEAREIIE